MAKDPVKVSNFSGMNNVKASEGLFSYSRNGDIIGAEPRIILNADVTDRGRIVKRPGYELYVELAGPHSLGSCYGLMFCVSEGWLKKINHGIATDLCEVPGPDSPVAHVASEGKVYLASRHWTGALDTATGAVQSWGISLPEQPVLLPGVGNLPGGKYDVCFTAIRDGEPSGSGPIATIELDDAGTGITILNRPADCVVWATDPNGGVFYLCGPLDAIDVPPQKLEPLLSLFCFPPPRMDVLCLAFGRIWGARGKTVYYSEAGRYGWWKVYTSKFHHDHPVTMIAETPVGLYIGTEAETWFYEGTTPTEMRPRKVGRGAVKHSLVYCDGIGQFGDHTPCWLAPDGIVAGGVDGQQAHLTRTRVKFSPGPTAAAHYRMKDGQPQILAAFKGSTAGMTDAATCEVVRNGKVI